jgi:hypothetical protein
MELGGSSILGKRAAPENAGGGSGALNLATDSVGLSLQAGAQNIGRLPPPSGPPSTERPLARTEVQVRDVGPSSLPQQVKRLRVFSGYVVGILCIGHKRRILAIYVF